MSILSPYRVLDLTDAKGMLATKLLADMGAEVIRIENPVTHTIKESSEDIYLNAGKKRITLNLESEKGRALFKRLVETADFLVESFQPGYLESLEISYQQLSERYPRLIMTSITGFGQDGPYREYQVDDLALQAMGGWMSVTGEVDKPLKLYGNQAYYTASLFAVNAMLLALYERHRSGKGQHVDISVMECVAATLDYVLPRYLSEGIVSQRQGSRHWNNAFRVFRCKDGHILLFLHQHWETLVELLESEDMAADLTDEQWLDREFRNREIDHIIEILQSWTLRHTVTELEEKGQLMRFPWAGVRSMSQVLENPQLKERNYFSEIELVGSRKKFRAPGVALKMSISPWHSGNRVALPGGNNKEIYLQELGITNNDFETLIANSVI